MTSETSPGRTDGASLGLLHATALVAVLIGALGSVAFTLLAGHRNPSRFLIFLFVIWVLFPFVALVLATFLFKSWSVLARRTLYSVMLFLSLASLAIYGRVALGPPRAKTAFVFLVVSPLSFLVTIVAVSTAALISRRRSRQGGGG